MILRKDFFDISNMDKYFVIEPEQYNWDIYISNLTEGDKLFIQDFEEIEEDCQFCHINKCYFKYFTEIEWTKENNECHLVVDYLKKQGYKDLTKYYR